MSQIEEFATREAWLARRRQLVTASDVAAILGLDWHRTPLHVYADKVGAGETEELNEMWRGRIYQDAIAQDYARQTGRVVDDGLDSSLGIRMRIHPRYDWIGATNDALTYADDGENVPLELKLAIGSGWAWKEEPPKKFQVQVLVQTAVFGSSKGAIAGLVGPGPLCCADLPYDAELFELIVPRLREFLDRVERRDPPEPTSGLALEPLKRIFPMGNGETVELSHLPLGHTFEWAGDDPRKDDGIGRCGHPEGEPDRLGGRRTCWKTEPEHAERYAGMANEWERAKAESKRQDEIASGCQAVLRHQLGSAQWAKLSDGTYLERKINKAGADSLVRFRPKRKS